MSMSGPKRWKAMKPRTTAPTITPSRTRSRFSPLELHQLDQDYPSRCGAETIAPA